MRRRIAAAAAAALAVGAAPVIAAATPAAAAPADRGMEVHIRPPLLRAPLSRSVVTPSLTPAGCLALTGGTVACQTPESIRAAYSIPLTVNGELAGIGQTVAVVDAYGSPTVREDLATFSAAFGLPAPTLDIAYPTGAPQWQGTSDQVLWAEETSLDVQWVHAVAPGARIVLVVASNSQGNVLNLAERYAVDHYPGSAMSLSFGDSESEIHGNSTQAAQAHRIYEQARANGTTVFASSGDAGSDGGTGQPNFAFPAADPLVTAVGGTTLYAGSGLDQPRETVWGDYAACPLTCASGPAGATGGAPSILGGKDGSDVAYDASAYTGVMICVGFLGDASGFYPIGGTSAGVPQWAAITAILSQAAGRPLGYIRDQLPLWAASGGLFDVTVGSNATPTFAGGFSAGPGRDLPTGYGTPDVGRLLQLVTR